jgi:type 1 glutamine amidotransferase
VKLPAFRCLLMVSCLLTVIVIPAIADEAKTKILLIGKKPDHPWGTHMYMHTSKILAKCLEKTAGVETVVSEGWPADAETLEGVKTIVVYSSPAAEMLLDGPGSSELDKMMRSGVGLVTIHWASSVLEQNLGRLGDRWISYMGGVWVTNYGLSTDTSLLKQLDPEHPICRGWKEYELHDEYYLKPTIKGAKPLLQVTTKGEDVVVGWAFERAGDGRAYATTLGHFYRNFQQEAFRKTIVNAILWTAHVEVPANGAPVDLTEEELKLPPNPAAPAK